MPSRPPGEVAAFETLLLNGSIADEGKPAKFITLPTTRRLP